MKPIGKPLEHFLGGYLHQDFDLDYADSDEAATAFGREEDPATVLRTLGQITAILASGPAVDELRRTLFEAGSEYRATPDSVTWLARVRDVMAGAYASRLDVDSF